MGYAQAGWTVTGVDIVPRPRNPHPVIIADALEYLAEQFSQHNRGKNRKAGGSGDPLGLF